jgi:hypothetical protein
VAEKKDAQKFRYSAFRIWRSSLEANSTSHRQRFLLLSELQVTMATFARPVASSIAGVDFTVYSDEEIKKLSVKRIHNTPTLDSFNNPVPGGLYDPAMGAWGDHVYVFICTLREPLNLLTRTIWEIFLGVLHVVRTLGRAPVMPATSSFLSRSIMLPSSTIFTAYSVRSVSTAIACKCPATRSTCISANCAFYSMV